MGHNSSHGCASRASPQAHKALTRCGAHQLPRPRHVRRPTTSTQGLYHCFPSSKMQGSSARGRPACMPRLSLAWFITAQANGSNVAVHAAAKALTCFARLGSGSDTSTTVHAAGSGAPRKCCLQRPPPRRSSPGNNWLGQCHKHCRPRPGWGTDSTGTVHAASQGTFLPC